MTQLTFLDDATPEPPRYGAFGRRSEVTAPAVLPPNVHNVDPVTSREAAEKHAAKRGPHMDLVLAMVRRNPGRTACELWADANADEARELGEVYEVRRRLTDLAAIGEVRQVGRRACEVRGTNQVTWEAVR